MTKCEDCWWYGKPIDCPADFNLSTYECRNFRTKGDENVAKKEFCIMPTDPHYSTERNDIYCHRHEVFFGTDNRQKSIKDGLVVFLKPEMHNMSNQGVHYNRRFDVYLKQIGEQAWCDYYGKTVDDFIKEYGRNYLGFEV